MKIGKSNKGKKRSMEVREYIRENGYFSHNSP
jgi:hypothetical protein